jgi:hypothetical protein
MSRLLKSLFLICYCSVSVFGASHYIRAGATGANNGSSWTDAWTTLPSGTTFVRGDEYFVADGTYNGGYNFSKAASGTIPIKICKATLSTVGSCLTAHGSDTGWLDTYGDGQAIFNGSGVSFSTPYWVFDGVSGAGSRASTGSNPSTYGFSFTPPLAGSTIRPVEYNASDIQIRHTAVSCPGPTGDIQQFGYSGTGDRVTLSYTYVNNCSSNYWNQGDDNIIEMSYLATNWSSPANHGVQVQQVLRPIFRNNIVSSCVPQCIEPGGGSTTNINNGQYYNNVFANVNGTNGVLKGTSSGAIIDTLIYGNTVVNSQGPILYQNNEGLGNGTGNTVVNNLFYNCSSIMNQSTGGPITHSNNALFDSGSLTETGVQIGSGNPFVNSAAGDYRLKAATNAGLTLAPPYMPDLMGVSHGTDGVWDRGAYEFVSGSLLSACDLNGDSSTNVSDVQICVNQAIGMAMCAAGDINQDGACNVVDVQRVVNAALGGLCVTN